MPEKGIEMFRKVKVPVLGVVENMSTHTCSQCGHSEAVFGAGGGSASPRNTRRACWAAAADPEHPRNADGGRPSVIAEPQGEVAKCFLSIARQVIETLDTAEADEGPSISFSEPEPTRRRRRRREVSSGAAGRYRCWPAFSWRLTRAPPPSVSQVRSMSIKSDKWYPSHGRKPRHDRTL